MSLYLICRDVLLGVNTLLTDSDGMKNAKQTLESQPAFVVQQPLEYRQLSVLPFKTCCYGIQ